MVLFHKALLDQTLVSLLKQRVTLWKKKMIFRTTYMTHIGEGGGWGADEGEAKASDLDKYMEEPPLRVPKAGSNKFEI